MIAQNLRRYNYQLVWNTLDQGCFKEFSNKNFRQSEQEFFRLLIKIEHIHPKKS